jgi:hypothetical protein
MNFNYYIVLGVVGFVFLFAIILFILKKMRNSIDLIPVASNYIAGETIKGKLILRLKKHVKSEKLVIGLICEKTEGTYFHMKKSRNAGKEILFDFNQPLEGKKEYSPSEYSYDFSIVTPLNVSEKLEDSPGQEIKHVQILINQNSPIKWYLYAELQGNKVNLYKRVQVNIV